MNASVKGVSVMVRRTGFGLLVCALAACSNDTYVNDDGGKGPDGGVGDGAVETGPVGGCDTTRLPTEDTCVVNDGEGIFVSSSMGSASGDGTKAKPFASLQAGIAAATPVKKRVYACAETYAETITLADGVSIFGYFKCSQGWTIGTSHAKVQPATSPVATAANITDPTRVEAVDLVAPDFTDNSKSSIGIIVNGSPALTIVNATIHAGTGGKGATGSAGASLTDSGAAKNGKNSPYAYGGCAPGAIGCTSLGVINSRATATAAGGTNACGTGNAGGDGGGGGMGGEFQAVNNSWTAVTGYPVTGGSPTQATTTTAQGGGASGTPFNANPGQNGTDGAAGQDGNSGSAVGTFSASGYASSDGSAGTDGTPGTGGGGAGGWGPWSGAPTPSSGFYGWGEGGGGGGAGGCPGLAGKPGKGGGASVAIIALQSPFVLDTVTVESSAGGDGGAAGSPGVPSSYAGGAGGAHLSSSLTGNGGHGGAGGAAGLSGDGGGGPSIGLAYQGTEPTHATATITPGAGGAGVTTGKTSPAGQSAAVYSF